MKGKYTKNSFILYNSYRKHIDILTLEQKGVLFTAIFEYSETQEIIEMEDVVKMAFNFIAEDIDINRKKWEEMADIRSEAGRKGAKARWKDHKKDNSSKDNIANDGKRILPMANDGKNAVNGSGNVNGNVNGNDSIKTISKDKPTASHGDKELKAFRKELIRKYPCNLEGITDNRILHNVRTVCSPRKNRDEWMDENWKENFKQFFMDYGKSVSDTKYMVRSMSKLKDKIKQWREYGGVLK